MHEFGRGGKPCAERDGGQVAVKPTQKRRKPERVWDGRGDALEDARLTTAAGRLADDLRLRETHFRIMAHVGRQNGARGWLRVSQSELAARWAVHRNTVNRAFGQLVEWEYLKQRTQEQAGESFCLYKVALDDEAELPPAARTRAPGGEGECNPTSAPHAGGECRARSAPVQRQQCTRAHGRSAPHTQDTRAHRQTPDSAEVIPPSRPPHGARAEGGRGGAKLVHEDEGNLRTTSGLDTRGWASRWDQAARAAVFDLIGGEHQHVATVLLVPLVGTLQPPVGVHGASYVRDVADRLGMWPAPVLARVAEAVKARQVRDMPAAATLRQWAAVAAHQLDGECKAEPAPSRVDTHGWLAELTRADGSRPEIALARQLVARLGADVTAAWFNGLAVAHSGRLVLVTLPTKFCARYAAQHYADDVKLAARAVWPEVESVRIEAARPQARAA